MYRKLHKLLYIHAITSYSSINRNNYLHVQEQRVIIKTVSEKNIKEMNINFLVYLNYYSCITALNTSLVDPQCICTKTKDAALHVHCSRPRTKHSKLLMLPALLEIELLQ